ncbi:MAG TPA: hypothetical protein VFH13_05930, partial [Gemmatimonadaceae bacterium]|nr:hypothetical protein [Gemmatimonadaceae bacterium]
MLREHVGYEDIPPLLHRSVTTPLPRFLARFTAAIGVGTDVRDRVAGLNYIARPRLSEFEGATAV